MNVDIIFSSSVIEDNVKDYFTLNFIQPDTQRVERVFAISVFSEGDQGETILETFVQEGLTEGRNTDAT